MGTSGVVQRKHEAQPNRVADAPYAIGGIYKHLQGQDMTMRFGTGAQVVEAA